MHSIFQLLFIIARTKRLRKNESTELNLFMLSTKVKVYKILNYLFQACTWKSYFV